MAPAAVAQAFGDPGSSIKPPAPIDQSQPLYLQADQLIYDNAGNAVTARGNVEIYYSNYVLTAQEVVYDQGANTLTAVGNVVIKEPNGSIIRADRYTLTDDFRDGFVQQLSVVTNDDTRIAAERATRRDGSVTEFSDAKFSPCKSAEGVPPLWCISAKRIIHDTDAATITYQDAAFEIFGQPIIYLPYFQHADPSVKRRSGFLLPTYGSSSDLGFSTSIPYYFALAPNYDFTFAPQYKSKQGILWQGDWRHRLANGEYTIEFAAIDQDLADLPTGSKSDLDGWRGSLKTKGLFSLSSWWNAGWDVTLESDDTFRRFYKLDSRILTDRVNKIWLEGISDRNYFSANLYQFNGLLVEDSPNSESNVHPVIDHNYVLDEPLLGGEIKFDTNVLSFSRSDFWTDGTSRQDMNRVVSQVTWRRKLIDAIGITYTPFANLRGDVYQLNNYIDPVTGEAVAEESIARGSAAGGLTVAYPWVASDRLGSHTIEPIGQVIARTESVPQRRLPNEDAKSLVFDDTTLFDINKFSGYDRLETGTRANVGVQYTFQTNWGGYARLLAGQSFQLSGENAFADPGQVNPLADTDQYVFTRRSGLETDESDYVLGAYIAPISAFRLISQSRFDSHDFDFRQQRLVAVADYGPLFGSAVYTYSATDPEFGVDQSLQDITGTLGVRLTDRWQLIASALYNIEDDFVLSNSITLRYSDECFVLTASYIDSRFEQPEAGIESDRAIMLRFEFKHLGQLDYNTNISNIVSQQ